MRALIAAGGTGGHIYPALAVARSLRARLDDAELTWVGGHRGLEAGIVPSAGIRFRRLALRSLRSVEANAHAILDPIRLGASVPQATALLARERPDAIFTTGGYVAVPILLAAAPLRIPVVLWDGNVVPGRAVVGRADRHLQYLAQLRIVRAGRDQVARFARSAGLEQGERGRAVIEHRIQMARHPL